MEQKINKKKWRGGFVLLFKENLPEKIETHSKVLTVVQMYYDETLNLSEKLRVPNAVVIMSADIDIFPETFPRINYNQLMKQNEILGVRYENKDGSLRHLILIVPPASSYQFLPPDIQKVLVRAGSLSDTILVSESFLGKNIDAFYKQRSLFQHIIVGDSKKENDKIANTILSVLSNNRVKNAEEKIQRITNHFE